MKYLYGLMGTRGGGAGRVLLRDVKVPEENVIGKEGQGAETSCKVSGGMMTPARWWRGVRQQKVYRSIAGTGCLSQKSRHS